VLAGRVRKEVAALASLLGLFVLDLVIYSFFFGVDGKLGEVDEQ
jgi:hypothetical protein